MNKLSDLESTTSKTEVESAIENAKEPIYREFEDMPFQLLPPNWSAKELPHLLPQPLRIVESPIFNHPESFARYYKIFAESSTRIFADDNKKQAVSVFDCSEPHEPGHGDHRATLAMQEAPEWEVWKKISGKKLDRSDFSRFIEKNLDFITDESGMSGADILGMCRDLRIKGSGDIIAKEDYTNGKRSLDIKLNHQVGGNTETGELIPFPENVTVSLRVFKNAARFDFKAQLRWDIKQEQLYFTIDLAESSIIEDDAFQKVVETIEAECDQSVFIGSYRSSKNNL